jgi:hypothetical protein
MFTYLLYGLAVVALAISFFKDRQKTKAALKKAWKAFENILPQLLTIFLIIGFALAIFSVETIQMSWIGLRSPGRVCGGPSVDYADAGIRAFRGGGAAAKRRR